MPRHQIWGIDNRHSSQEVKILNDSSLNETTFLTVTFVSHTFTHWSEQINDNFCRVRKRLHDKNKASMVNEKRFRLNCSYLKGCHIIIWCVLHMFVWLITCGVVWCCDVRFSHYSQSPIIASLTATLILYSAPFFFLIWILLLISHEQLVRTHSNVHHLEIVIRSEKVLGKPSYY